MTIDTIAARNKRIEELAQKLGERERLWIEAMDEAQTQKDRAEVAEAKLARAERLAEAAGRLNPMASDDEWREMREALTAYRSPEPAAESEA